MEPPLQSSVEPLTSMPSSEWRSKGTLAVAPPLAFGFCSIGSCNRNSSHWTESGSRHPTSPQQTVGRDMRILVKSPIPDFIRGRAVTIHVSVRFAVDRQNLGPASAPFPCCQRRGLVLKVAADCMRIGYPSLYAVIPKPTQGLLQRSARLALQRHYRLAIGHVGANVRTA